MLVLVEVMILGNHTAEKRSPTQKVPQVSTVELIKYLPSHPAVLRLYRFQVYICTKIKETQVLKHFAGDKSLYLPRPEFLVFILLLTLPIVIARVETLKAPSYRRRFATAVTVHIEHLTSSAILKSLV